MKNGEEEAMEEGEAPMEEGGDPTVGEAHTVEAADGLIGGGRAEVMSAIGIGDRFPWRRARKWTLQWNP